MTGLDALKEELRSRGLTKAQYESRAVREVVDIFAQCNGEYTKYVDTIESLEDEVSSLRDQIKSLEYRAECLRGETAHLAQERKKKWAEALEYIGKFNESLKECETESGRDAMRRAQVFINSVNVDTKYDNTAYIVSLGAILSEGNIGAITELKKINKSLPGVGDFKGEIMIYDDAWRV